MRLGRRKSPNVRRLAQRGDLRGLRKASTYTERIADRNGRVVDLGGRVRLQAVNALSAFYGEQVTDGLRERISDTSPEVVHASIRALERMGTSGAHGVLLEVVANPNDAEGVRESAFAALERAGAAGLPERLVELLVTRRHTALGEFDRRALDGLVMADDRGSEQAALATVTAAVRLLDGSDGWARAQAEQIVAWYPAQAGGLLIGRLTNQEASPAVLRAAGASGDLRLLDPLLEKLADRRPDIRRSAAEALGQLRHVRVVEPLMKASSDREPGVRGAALDALDGLGVMAITVGLASMMRAGIAPPPAGGEPGELADGPWAREVVDQLEARGLSAAELAWRVRGEGRGA